jgi:hypothetical protein
MVGIRRARPRLPRAFAVVAFLLAIAPSLFAGGQKEDRLAKADQLIAERKYNEAIVALTQFIKDQPERFDDAQKRLQRISRLRNEYNALAAELLDVLVNDPTNDERKLAMIARLEELEAEPNRSAQEFITRTRDTALFTLNKAKFEAIMADGRKLLDAADYAGAAKRYAEGFELYRPEFKKAGYGQLVVDRVDAGVAAVQAQVSALGVRLDAIRKAVANAEAALGALAADAAPPGAAAMAAAADAFAAADSALLELAAMRNTVVASGRAFENQFTLLQGADKNLGENSFLPFAYRLVLGRKTELRQEGVLGALDIVWIDLANRSQTAAVAAADRVYAAALAAASGGTAPTAAVAAARAAGFESAAAAADLAQRAVGLWAAVIGAESAPVVTGYGKTIIAGKPPVYLNYQVLAKAERFRAASERLAGRLADLEAAAAATAALPPGPAVVEPARADRQAFLALASDAGTAAAAVSEYAAQVGAYRSGNAVAAAAPSYLDDSAALLAELGRTATAAEVSQSVVQYRGLVAAAVATVSVRRADFERARLLAEGAPTDAGAVLRYPTESLPVFAAAAADSGRDAATAGALAARLDAESAAARADARFAALVADVKAASSALSGLAAQARAAGEAARQKSEQAAAAKAEGDKRYEEATAALARYAFDQARDRITRAGERYDFSLSLQESVALRAERDQKLLTLAAELAKAENEVVVRDVRALITQAKDAYFAGTFDTAEESLVQAQNRWRTTNVDDEPEVTYWLALVRGALSIKTGRTIPATAPLYAEMSQLLSYAHQLFVEGSALLAARRKTDGLAKFDLAKQKLNEVRIVFPINQEAGLLELRIDQQADPDAFAAAFKKRVDAAAAKRRTAPQECYSELLDLYEINPKYSGLKALIQEVEYDIGVKLRPVDTTKTTQAAAIVAEVERIVSGKQVARYEYALGRLNEALQLDPNNSRVAPLKDRIQTEIGGQATVVLSAAAEQDYQRAVLELQKGNTINALAIVQSLLQDSRNKNSQRILELQRRIQARL